MSTTAQERITRADSAILADAPRVLFVDDDDDMLETYRTRLRTYSVHVQSARSGRDGLQLARDARPDVIVTDVCMARGDGDYLVGNLKKRSQTACIPVIVISGLDDPELALRMYRSGANCFLRKPVPFDRLVREIGRYIGIEHRRTLMPHHVPAEEPRFTTPRGNRRRFRLDLAHSQGFGRTA